MICGVIVGILTIPYLEQNDLNRLNFKLNKFPLSVVRLNELPKVINLNSYKLVHNIITVGIM